MPHRKIGVTMELITIKKRTTKEVGTIKLRFRLRDGRAVELYNKSDIEADIKDLEKFEDDGRLKDRIKLYNKKLKDDIKAEIGLMHDAYEKMKADGMDLNSDTFEKVIVAMKSPVEEVRQEIPSLIARFSQFTSDSLRDGVIGERRQTHYRVVESKLERFLLIKGLTRITAPEFTDALLMEFRNFIMDEYKYAEKYKRYYKDVAERNIPVARLSINTVTEQMKIMQALFTELEASDEVNKSPFRKLGKERRRVVMRTMYDEPYFLRIDELRTVINKEIPENLEDVRNAFVVQCAFGCRIGDFQKMGMSNIAVSEDGIPYVHYLPQKTADRENVNTEIKTPIVRYAFDIIMATRFQFKILGNISGCKGYNKKIKELLKVCEIERNVTQYDEEKKENIYLPLYEVGSSKLCRKTHVDIMNKVQINKYAAGLHKKGSTAVDRYTNMELGDRFDLMNIAFGQEAYRVDNELNIVSVKK